MSAVHSNIGSVKLRLLLNDERYVELTPGDTLAFEFAAPVGMQGWVRDFVFVSNGYYITEGEGGPQTSSDNIPLIHSLCIYPNPGRKDMSIRFGLPKEEKISVKIFDVSGREVKTLVDKRLKAGYHIVRLDNMNLPSGIYFARLVTDNYKETKKLVVVR